MIQTYDTFFTEREMNNLIQSCNEVLTRTTIEQDELKNQLIDVQKQCNLIENQNQKLTHVSHYKKKENEEREFILKDNLRVLAYLEGINNILLQKNQDNQLQLEMEMIHFDNLSFETQDLIQIDDSAKRKIIQNLQQYKDEIQTQCKKLSNEVLLWKCIRCEKEFREGENEKTCIYHPGKLKYYSCRGCGQDDYYTCCNKCKKCSPGCTKNLHQP